MSETSVIGQVPKGKSYGAWLPKILWLKLIKISRASTIRLGINAG
jgi:hypothetical protein